VLVGHSLGALIARLYVSRYPDEVAGMVIADHAVNLAEKKNSGARITRQPAQPSGRAPDPNAGFEKLPQRDYQLHIWANSRPGLPEVMKRNGEMVGECTSELEAATRNEANPFGDKPFIALSHGGTRDLHTQLLSLSLNSKQVVAANSGHLVMVDRPDIVVDAIREVVQAVRNRSRLKH
jgi:pimeloyl-ACP methyl ester carboxylesterase